MAPPASAAAATAAAAWAWAPGAAAFAKGLQPYKRVGAVLIREDCMSVAVSNPYMNLAERAGGVMLREGRVPARALQLLVTKAVAPSDLGGWVIGCERGTPDPTLLPVDRARTLSELLRAIQGVSPGLPLCWHTQALGEGPSCRITPPGGGAGGGAAGGGAAAGLAECSVGRDFLQSFLDGLGALNTFG